MSRLRCVSMAARMTLLSIFRKYITVPIVDRETYEKNDSFNIQLHDPVQVVKSSGMNTFRITPWVFPSISRPMSC